MGIWVNLYAFTISGSEDNWHSIYLAGSYDAGVFAADAIKSSIDAENLDPSGKIALFYVCNQHIWRGNVPRAV